MADIRNADLASIELGMLASLQALLAERSVTRAARRLGRSQPAMSNALRRMRAAFGDPLMTRGSSGNILTRRGEDLLQQLDLVLPQLDALGTSAAFDPMTHPAFFKVAMTDYATQLLMPRVIDRLRRESPKSELSISTVQNSRIDTDKLEMERFDLRVGWLHSLPAGWYTRVLIQDELVIISSAENVAVSRRMNVAAFAALPHVAVATERPPYHTIIDQVLAGQGARRNAVAWVTHFTTIPSMIVGTDLVAVFPRTLAALFARYMPIRAHPSPVAFGDFSMSMAWHPRIQKDPAYTWLRGLILDCAVRIVRGRSG